VYFDLDTVVLDAAQALCIALPGAGVPAVLLRLGGRGWALLAPVSLVGTLVAIRLVPNSADVLTWIALILVPPGCALALGWAAHGARPWLAVLVVPLLVAALAAPEQAVGRVARVLLIVGSTATAGRLLAAAAPRPLLKAGVIAMATVDAILVLGDRFDAQFAGFDAASPGAGLPQLQLARVGEVATDYGDFFLAGLVGAILAVERGPQLAAAVAMLVAAEAWNQLFLVVDSLPNTTAPALVLIGWEVWRRRGVIVSA
jgi:hypothetical protein